MTIPTDIDSVELAILTQLLVQRGAISKGAVLEVELISGGRSNLTYELRSPGSSLILRRPPLGHVLSTAHDMSREYRVLTALGGEKSLVPVPSTVLSCEDPSVLGAPFYVMQKAEGVVLRTSRQALELTEAEQLQVARHLIEVLADLHSVEPAAVGLADFGRPEGFMSRQVRRWAENMSLSHSRPIHGIDELAALLAVEIPQGQSVAVLHGDYRLDNCLVKDGRVEAVLDWEMSTLGDPMSDLGMFVVYYAGLSDIPNPVVQSLGGLGAFPTIDVLLSHYALLTGRDVSHLSWYVAFAWFKLAVILEGIHFRSTLASAEHSFDGVADLVQPCVDRGLRTFREQYGDRTPSSTKLPKGRM